MKNIAVFVSGNGTNLQAIIDSIAKGRLPVNLSLVVSDQRNAFALKRAEKAGVKTFCFDPKEFGSKEAYEKVIIACLKREKVDLVVLAGFMRILSPFFVRKYKNRILNIHPALLPSFKGAHAIRDAFYAGVKVSGVTVHFVDEKVDNGPIIAQEPVEILDSDTLDEFEAKIHRVEHRLYPQAIGRLIRGRFVTRGRKAISVK